MPKVKKLTVEKSTDRVLIRLDLPPEEHSEVRVAAARQGISMARMARVAVLEYARTVNEKSGK